LLFVCSWHVVYIRCYLFQASTGTCQALYDQDDFSYFLLPGKVKVRTKVEMVNSFWFIWNRLKFYTGFAVHSLINQIVPKIQVFLFPTIRDQLNNNAHFTTVFVVGWSWLLSTQRFIDGFFFSIFISYFYLFLFILKYLFVDIFFRNCANTYFHWLFCKKIPWTIVLC